MTPRPYVNFDLHIAREHDQYRSYVASAPRGQGAEATFALSFVQEIAASFQWLSSGLLRHVKLISSQPQAPVALLPDDFGRQLYDVVLANKVGTALQLSLEWVQANQYGLRLRVCLHANAAELAELPWEYLYSTDLGRFVALSDDTVVVRHLAQDRLETVHIDYPLRILAVISDPTDLDKLNVEAEWQRIQQALANLEASGLIALERLPRATIEDLQTRLRRDDVHALHFIGHGYFDAKSHQGGLVLEHTEERTAHLVNASDLAVLLHDRKALRLIFLNACEGARSAASDLFSGTAQTLVRHGVAAAVAMQYPIGDRAAIALAQTFYASLADNLAVDTALAQARKAVYFLNKEQPEWGTPVLFSRMEDGQIVTLPEGDRRPIIPTLPFEPKTIRIPGGSFIMGTPPGEAVPVEETPEHKVELPTVRIGLYPVTNREYGEFLKHDKQIAAPREWFLREPPNDKLDHPISDISWHDAVAYCTWLRDLTGRNYRLPTEAEWERAARGTAGRRYPWGDTWEDNTCHVAAEGTTPVTAYPAGVTDEGCYDLLGNVQEWVSTRWGSTLQQSDSPYPYQPDDGRENHNFTPRERIYCVHRGGSYRNSPTEVYASARGRADATSKCAWRGFRVAMELT